jgi:hypothetical protein
VTSIRAKWSLGILVAGYFALAVVAGAPRSPLTVPLPAGARPPVWTADLARLGHIAQTIFGAGAAATAVKVAFLLFFVALVWRFARSSNASDPAV